MLEINPEQLKQRIFSVVQELKQDVPDVINSFLNMGTEVLKSKVLDSKTKSMIALAIAINNNSKECLTFHLKNLLKLDLSYEELLEIISVSTYMGGGLAFASAIELLEIYEQLKKRELITAYFRYLYHFIIFSNFFMKAVW